MRIRTPIAGNRGYLYVDLIVAMAILSLTLASLFAASRDLKQKMVLERDLLQSGIDIYEEQLLQEADL